MQRWETKQGQTHHSTYLLSYGGETGALITDKSAVPCCFCNQNINGMPMQYKNSTKAWMTNTIYNQYFNDLNCQMVRSNKCILLFVDNAPVHIISNKTKIC